MLGRVYETASGVRSLKYLVTPYGRAVKNGSTWDYEYNLTDHLGNVRAVIRKGSNNLAELVQQKHYYPFGMEISNISLGTGNNKYLYNGKEIQDDFNLYWYDYGARFYDPALGRWHSVDPLAGKNSDRSPYHFVSNNPISRIDPDGRDDYSINKKTGKFTLEKKTDDETDRVLRTNRIGEIKTNKKGEAKVAFGDIEKGILSDGVNFKENNNLIEVGGEGQATQDGVEAFALKLANHVGVEIAGAYFSQDGSGSTSHITIGKYVNNSLTQAKGHGNILYNKTFLKLDMNDLTSFFHTHPSNGFRESDRTSASPADKIARNNALLMNPKMRFFIITNPINHGGKFPLKIDYTNH